MNEKNVLLSKIVANSTKNAWCQAYSTINLYIAISLEKAEEQEGIIASLGKQTLEKLQKEYFALEEKKLSEIKKGVENVVGEIPNDVNYSIILATIASNVLCIVTAGLGSVVIKRNDQIGLVADGEKEKVSAFSGQLMNNDTVLIQTQGFSKKIPPSKLLKLIDTLEVLDIAENIAPIIHGGSDGTEAAIILNFKKPLGEIGSTSRETNEKILSSQTSQRIFKGFKLPHLSLVSLPLNLHQFTMFISKLKQNLVFNKKILIVTAIVALSAVLIIGLTLEKKKQVEKKNAVLLQNIMTPAQKKYDEAITLINLNKSLAKDSLLEAKKTLNNGESQFDTNSDEKKTINAFLSKVEEKLNELEEGALIKNQKVIYTKDDANIKEITDLTFKGGDLMLLDKKTGNVIVLSKNDYKVVKVIKTEQKEVNLLNADKSYLYLASEGGIYKVDKGNQKAQKVAGKNSIVAIDNFLGNVYLLNQESKTIEKYVAGSSSKSAYFDKEVKLHSPLSMTIDGSIWVLDERDQEVLLRKFTKGKEDDFSIKNSISDISKNSTIYTDSQFSNLYILDKDSQKVLVITKKGEFLNQYNLKSMGEVKYFTVDESGKKIYIGDTNKIYSFDL